MKIDFNPNLVINNVNNQNIKKNFDSNEFSKLLNSKKTEESSGTSSNLNVSNINIILEIEQELDKQKKKQTIKKAREILAELNNIKIALVNNNLNLSNLKQIQEKIENLQNENISDPKLNNILKEIEIRAAVEFEKLKLST